MVQIKDDPVYNQPAPSSKSSSSDSETGNESQRPRQQDGTGAVTEDPVYNQPRPSDKDRAGKTVIDDPTCNQPAPQKPSSVGEGGSSDHPAEKSKASQVPSRRDGKGEVTEDPVYDQSAPTGTKMDAKHDSKAEGIADDPTYNQPSHGSSDSDQSNHPTNDDESQRPRQQDGTGEITEDPTYDQPKPEENGSQGIEDDPTYNQPKPASDTSTSKDKASSSSSPSTDPSTSNTSTSSSRAKSRLTQLTSQIAPTPTESPPPTTQFQPQPHSHSRSTSRSRSRRPKRKSKPKDTQSALPQDYTDITTALATMRHQANNPPSTHRGYTRQLSSGKLTARQRIATLLAPNSFREIGSVAGSTIWKQNPENPIMESVEEFTPANNPQGFGAIICLRTGKESVKRQVYLTADDFAIRGGHADGHNGLRTLYGEKMALRLKVPVVKLTDGSSGGGSVSTIAKQGWSYLPYMTVLAPVIKQLNMGIPNLGAVVGPAIGLGAARVVSTHFSVMAADVGSLFNAGPKVVEGATFEEGLSFSELGGPGVHCCNGTIDNMARDEGECYEQIRTVLGYLPDCGALQAPPCLSEGWSGDSVDREDEGLRTAIPRKKNRMYNPYTIIESVVDRQSWFEIGRLWGCTAIVGLARLGGRPVAILSNNCEVNGGALDTGGSQKLMKMIKFADVFNLPIVQFVDIPGYAIGTVAERTGVMKWGVELGKAYYTSTTPIFSVLTRRAYGVAGGIMLDSRDPWMKVVWPSANWGSLPLDGGIEVGHRHELKTIREKAEIEKPGSGEAAFRKRYTELEDMYLRLMNPVRTANVFNVEEIIDPKDTRRMCCRWTKEMYGAVMQERLADRAAGRIVPVFT